MKLSSPAFANGAFLPFDTAYEAGNISPSLLWSDVPAGTVTLALSCDDTAGPGDRNWTHWLLWDIPACETRLSPGLPPYERLDGGMTQGLNDYLELGWGGPCPPEGLHRYVFTLYALTGRLEPAGRSRSHFAAAIGPLILDMATLTGYYRSEDAGLGFLPSLRLPGVLEPWMGRA
ncbi:MAG: YbhB/YbcL family Raf kinase inhibitor-like protein [Clostridia bacterium]|jgi:Raf kinase inhibitor-like YbhB/YbcL family protein